MSKRSNESDAEYKARKKAKKEKKKVKKEKKEKSQKQEQVQTETDGVVTASNEPCWNSFSDTPFAKPIQQALHDAGFIKPSPIQARAWPVALTGKDLIAVAKTGSGKTLGFLLPIFHRVSTKDIPGGTQAACSSSSLPAPVCLVLSPTRELAIQIHGECVKFGSAINIRAECVYGGTNVQTQAKQLKAADPQILIATPGRLCDLLERKVLSLSNCPFAILDEADRMLDMGFEKQITTVMNVLPEDRQTLFFTATWPKAVRRAAASYLRKEETTEVFIGGAGDGELAANKAVTQTFVEAQDDEKDKKLYDLLCGLEDSASVVIFANTKRRVDYVAKAFWQEGFATVAVHGDKPQYERDASLKKFITKESNIMVATDVAARGLDIKGVTHVINFDMARDVESYVHRIGRTGRAGEVGASVTFWNPDYDKPCSPALVVLAKNAGQQIPQFLQKYEKAKASKQWRVANAEKAAAELLTSS
uniref:RNA helicase n=1 Tax=Odontella aurita TaxID=265563 RepID=A0A7S4N7C1_9STRA|mmetsp:Transcript_50640/g.152546  ORF Transcript_50640/g.152546 Transcript_50640/m.152546 type:complete len:476 (+) Transcript_50640:53-1480(+)